MDQKKCDKCHKPLTSKFCTAMNNNYHPQCFTCHRCNQVLTGTQFHLVDGKPVCDNDYRKSLDKCFACGQPIADNILIALENKYHPNCFKCSVCQKPVSGQKFYTDDNKRIYCFDDYAKTKAKQCFLCKQAIMPTAGQTECKWIVSMNKFYHVQCYKCEDCGVLLSDDTVNRKCYPIGEHMLCLKCNVKRKTH